MLITSLVKTAPRLARRAAPSAVGRWQSVRGLATPSEPYDVVIIGGGTCSLVVSHTVERLILLVIERSRWLCCGH